MPHDFPFTPDPAFKFGCGRYRQEEHLLENCAEEVARFGRRPLFVCDATSQAIAWEKVSSSLRASGMEPRLLRHDGFCNLDDALARAGEGALDGIDVVIGCGGGVVIDFSKCLADIAGAPVVTMPTSSAQCCAFTPIAVCYTREGRYFKTALFRREIAAALIDMTVLSRQPRRLLVAGALDAMAKKIEIEFWTQIDCLNHGIHGIHGNCGGEDNNQEKLPCIPCVPWLNNTIPLPSLIASSIADLVYEQLDRDLDQAVADLAKGEPTQVLRETVFSSIVGAGIVSGISGGKRQTALAHRFYFFARQRLATLPRPNDPTTKRPNDQTIKRPNDPTTKRPNDQTIKRPNDPTTKRPNDQTIKRPNDPTTKRPNDQTVQRSLTHGELVAIGLVLQLAYYGRFVEAEALAARLRGWGLAASAAEIGLPHDEAEARACFDFLAATREMKAAGASALPRLREAVARVF